MGFSQQFQKWLSKVTRECIHIVQARATEIHLPLAPTEIFLTGLCHTLVHWWKAASAFEKKRNPPYQEKGTYMKSLSSSSSSSSSLLNFWGRAIAEEFVVDFCCSGFSFLPFSVASAVPLLDADATEVAAAVFPTELFRLESWYHICIWRSWLTRVGLATLDGKNCNSKVGKEVNTN